MTIPHRTEQEVRKYEQKDIIRDFARKSLKIPKLFLSTNSVLYNKLEDFGYSVTYGHRDQLYTSNIQERFRKRN